MRTKAFKLIALLLVVAITSLTLSSCNRGVGCPNRFSIKTTLDK